MSDVKWEQISFEELADLPVSEQVKCRIRIGDVSRQVFRADAFGVTLEKPTGDEVFWATERVVRCWNAVVERPVPAHPHGRIPDEEGAVIRVDKGYLHPLVFELMLGEWYETGSDDPNSTGWAQALADKHGFTVLWPRKGAGE